MNLQNKIDENKEIIYNLAKDIQHNIGSPDIDLDEIITTILIIILMNFPGMKTPKDINTMLIRIFDHQKKQNDVFKITNMPYKVQVEPPVMSIENYFLLMKEQFENIHNAPKIISINSAGFIEKLSKEKLSE
jgi:hypothetical protein